MLVVALEIWHFISRNVRLVFLLKHLYEFFSKTLFIIQAINLFKTSFLRFLLE